jgi:glycosyltransferase involved in cell wall biosynthesis
VSLQASPIRICVLIDSLGYGGAEWLLGDLAEVAPEAGLHLEVAYLFDRDGSPAAARLERAGVHPVQVPVSRLASPAAHRAVARYLRHRAPDVVHTQLGYADFLGGAAAHRLSMPCVTTLHVSNWRDERAVRERAKLRMFAEVRRRMTRVIAVSDAVRTAYVRDWNEQPDHVITVRNGIVPRAGAGGAEVKRALGIGADEAVLGMVSVLRPGKGHRLAIEAMRCLAPTHPNLRLVIAGDGPARPSLEAAARGLGKQIVFAGHRDDVPRFLDAVDVMVHPSEYEALPTVLLEAMAASVPIVATDVGGIPEIVAHGETGLLVPACPTPEVLAAAVTALLDDHDVRSRFAARSRQRFATEFDAAHWAERLRRVYVDAIARVPASRSPRSAVTPAAKARLRAGADVFTANRAARSLR